MVSATRGAATAGVLVVAAVFMVVFTASTMSPAGAAIEYRVCFVLFLARSPTLPPCGARANQGGGVRTPPPVAGVRRRPQQTPAFASSVFACGVRLTDGRYDWHAGARALVCPAHGPSGRGAAAGVSAPTGGLRARQTQQGSAGGAEAAADDTM